MEIFTILGDFVKLYTKIGYFKNYLLKIDNFDYDVNCNYIRRRKVIFYTNYASVITTTDVIKSKKYIVLLPTCW